VIRSIAFLLTVLTGFSGLAYQITWQKYLATLLGSHSEATAAGLDVFLAVLVPALLLPALIGGWERRAREASRSHGSPARRRYSVAAGSTTRVAVRCGGWSWQRMW